MPLHRRTCAISKPGCIYFNAAAARFIAGNACTGCCAEKVKGNSTYCLVQKNHAVKKNIEPHCDEAGGKLQPVVDFNSCSGAGDCVRVCPYTVFELRTIAAADQAVLNLKGRLKTLFKKEKAYIIHPEACHACGLCVQACPEKAVRLVKVAGA